MSLTPLNASSFQLWRLSTTRRLRRFGPATTAAIKGRLDLVLVDRIAVKGRSEMGAVYTVLLCQPIPAPDLALHTGIACRLVAGGSVAQAEDAELARRHPALGAVHERLRGRLASGPGGCQRGVVAETSFGERL